MELAAFTFDLQNRLERAAKLTPDALGENNFLPRSGDQKTLRLHPGRALPERTDHRLPAARQRLQLGRTGMGLQGLAQFLSQRQQPAVIDKLLPYNGPPFASGVRGFGARDAHANLTRVEASAPAPWI